MALRLLPILCLFLLSSCSNGLFIKRATLNVAVSETDYKLVKKIKDKYGDKKIKVFCSDCFFTKALQLIDEEKVDLFIGSVNDDLYVQTNHEQSLEHLSFAKDGLVIITNPQNRVSNLSSDELKAIFLRKINNWKQVPEANKKLPGNPIVVIDHERTCDVREAFYYKLFKSSTVNFPKAITVNSPSEVHDAIVKFPNAISYQSNSEFKGGLSRPYIDNIPADEFNIQKGYFPLSRDIDVLFSSKLVKKNKKYDSLKDFVDFLLSPKGQAIVSSMDYIPLTNSEIEAVQMKSNPFYIGVAAPLEGVYSELGKSIVSAAKIAVNEINALGGIETKNLEIIVCNDKANADEALKCAKDFVKEGVSGVIGHLTSQASIEASKVYAKNKIVQITPASTHPWFTERPGARGYAFRTIGRDDKQARIIAETISELGVAHPARVAVLHNSTIYGNTLSALVEHEVNNLETDKIVEILALKQDNHQYHNEINEVDANVLVFVGEYGDAAQIIKELALSNKKDIVFIGADGVFSQAFIDGAGLRAEGAFVTGSTIEESLNLTSFKTKFREIYKQETSAFALNSYDATKMLIAAVAQAYKENLPVNKVLKETRHLGLTGLIYFNNIGDPVLPRIAMYQVQNGEFVKVR